jgi:cobalt-precorrin-7 (C5)-methyltransferase
VSANETDWVPSRAAASPERTDGPAVHAVGVGPGDAGLLTGRARSLLRDADAVAGFETVLDVVRDLTDATAFSCSYDDQTETLAAFADRVADGAAGVAVLMGDPNVSGYQFLTRVERAVDGPVRVVPGISSVQVAASRARTPLERSTVVSLHRRGSIADALARLVADAGERHLLVLPRPYDTMPGDVAAHLVENGVDPSLSALVYERLTHPAESVTRATLGDLAREAESDESGPDDGERFSDLSVLVVRASGPVDTSETPTEDKS